MRIKYALVPVVTAVSGMALGGGCELIVHSAKTVASLESYIGLVEVGVGLIPGAGGLKEGALRGAQAAQAAGMTDVFPFIQNWFMNAAMANVSKSALEAATDGLPAPDRHASSSINYELLWTAINEAFAHARERLSAAAAAAQVSGRRPHGRRHDQGAAGQHARRRLHQRSTISSSGIRYRRRDVRRRRRSGQRRSTSNGCSISSANFSCNSSSIRSRKNE